MKSRNVMFLLPNAFTTAALFFGFSAIFEAIAGNWKEAMIGILVAAFLDALDGRVARLTNTESDFGLEYDSLSDVVAFGVAPAVLMYQWSLHNLGKIGFAVAFLYCATTAIRLARFNTQRVGDRRYFIGIPSPAAAVIVATFVEAIESKEIMLSPIVVAFFCSVIALTMISRVRFFSFKGFDFKIRHPYRIILLIVLTLVVLNAVANNFFTLICALMFLYLFFGYFFYFRSFILSKRGQSVEEESNHKP